MVGVTVNGYAIVLNHCSVVVSGTSCLSRLKLSGFIPTIHLLPHQYNSFNNIYAIGKLLFMIV